MTTTTDDINDAEKSQVTDEDDDDDDSIDETTINDRINSLRCIVIPTAARISVLKQLLLQVKADPETPLRQQKIIDKALGIKAFNFNALWEAYQSINQHIPTIKGISKHDDTLRITYQLYQNSTYQQIFQKHESNPGDFTLKTPPTTLLTKPTDTSRKRKVSVNPFYKPTSNAVR